MKIFKLILLLLQVVLVGCTSHSNDIINTPDNTNQGKFVQLKTNGKKYDNMFISVASTEPEFYRVAGTSTDGYLWSFYIPDSISQHIWVLKFSGEFFAADTIKHAIVFTTVSNADTLKNYYHNFENNSDTLLIEGTFLKTVTEYDLPHDLLAVDFKKKSYLMENAKFPGFGFFYDPDNEKKYDDFINDYISKIKANPESVYYISSLSAALCRYQSLNELNDLKRMYDLFSPTLQNSDHGKKIIQHIESKEKFLNSTFENKTLPEMNSKISESIIQDSSKYNLIIFSASWCGPCIAEIPLLKEIYSDLSQNLIMTYISVDNDSTGIASWLGLMQKENIPWRSLLAMNESEAIKETYFVAGIPHVILVHPKSLTFEVVDVRIKEDKDKLYLLCGKPME